MTKSHTRRGLLACLLAFAALSIGASPAWAAGEANLVMPDLNAATFWGIGGGTLLMWGMLIPLAGLVFGMVIFRQLQALPVHRSMLQVSELIYETCKTYLQTQAKFIGILWA